MMTIDDIDCVLEVEENCFSIPWSKESFLRELNNNEIALYLVAKIENKAVGYIGVWKIIDEGHITNLAVHSDYRNLGIGSMLVSKLLSLCKENDVNAFTLEVRKSNTVAQRLYEKFGFKEEGIRKGYYEDNNEDAVIMWLR